MAFRLLVDVGDGLRPELRKLLLEAVKAGRISTLSMRPMLTAVDSLHVVDEENLPLLDYLL
jgi:hypothetical protein